MNRGFHLLSLQMDPKTDKLVRRTTVVATATAAYFLLTADYGPEPNILDPIKNAILSAQQSVKGMIFGDKSSKEDDHEQGKIAGSRNGKQQP